MAETAQEPGIFDVEDSEAKARALALARAQIAAGLGVPDEKVQVWLKDLAEGRVTPVPCK